MIQTSPLFLLFLVFLTLKLCNVITWPWLWVTVPLWGGLVLLAVIALSFLVIVGGIALIDVAEKKINAAKK